MYHKIHNVKNMTIKSSRTDDVFLDNNGIQPTCVKSKLPRKIRYKNYEYFFLVYGNSLHIHSVYTFFDMVNNREVSLY